MSISLLLIDPAVKLTELVRTITLSLHFAPAEHSSQYLSAYYIACSFHVPMKNHCFTLVLKLDILGIHLMFVLDSALTIKNTMDASLRGSYDYLFVLFNTYSMSFEHF